MSNRTELYASDTVNDDGAEAINLTGQDAGTRRGGHVMEAPSTAAQVVTPADDTDVDFAHRYIFIGGAGDITVQFADGGTAYTFTVPAGAILPIEAYSVNATDTDATNIILLR